MPEEPRRGGDQPFGGFGGFGPLEDLVGRLVAGLEQGLGHDERGPAPAGPQRPGTPRRRVSTPRLDRHGRDLTALARDDALDPVIGREDEIDAVLEVLARRLGRLDAAQRATLAAALPALEALLVDEDD